MPVSLLRGDRERGIDAYGTKLSGLWVGVGLLHRVHACCRFRKLRAGPVQLTAGVVQGDGSPGCLWCVGEMRLWAGEHVCRTDEWASAIGTGDGVRCVSSVRYEVCRCPRWRLDCRNGVSDNSCSVQQWKLVRQISPRQLKVFLIASAVYGGESLFGRHLEQGLTCHCSCVQTQDVWLPTDIHWP